MICFPFFCATPFFCKTLNLFFSYPSSFNSYPILYFAFPLKFFLYHLSSYWLVAIFPSIKISVCQGTNCGHCMCRPFTMLPVLFTINFLWKIYGILMIIGMHQVVKPYIFVYTVWCMFLLLRFRLLCHVCILACACELCIWCYVGMTISFSNICYHNICFAVRLFQSGYVQVNTSSIIFQIYHLTHFHSSHVWIYLMGLYSHTFKGGKCYLAVAYIVAYIIMQLHIIHQRPRIMIMCHMISDVIQNNLICIIRFHGIDIPILFQWGCQ